MREDVDREFRWCHQNGGATPSLENGATPLILPASGWASSVLLGHSNTSEVDLTYARNGDRRNCSGVRHMCALHAPCQWVALTQGMATL